VVRKTAWGLVLPVTLLGVALLMVGARSSRRPVAPVPVLSASGPVTPPRWDPDSRERIVRSNRARNQRELRQHPDESAAHVAAAFDIFNRVRTEAEQSVGPNPSPGGFGGMGGNDPQRRQWLLDRDRFVAAHLKDSVTPGIQHAEEAVRLAKDADEELVARRLRADGWLLRGDYERAKEEYRWLERLDPGSVIRLYARCFTHLGEPVPDSVWEVMQQFSFYPDPDRSRSLSLGQIEEAFAAHEEWQKRRPKDPSIEMRLGALCYRLAGERALLRQDRPQLESDAGEGMETFIYRHFPDLIRRGIAHYQRAIEQAHTASLRARAMEELAHGQLIAGDPDAAIATLRRAFALSSDLSMASAYARVAFQRLARSQVPSGEASTSEQAPGGSADAVGMDTAMAPPGISPGRLTRRSMRAGQLLREGDQLLRELQGPARGREAQERRQRTLNQLDELFPGSATGYDPSTGNVVDVDLERVRTAMDRLAQPEDEGMYVPGPGGPGGPRGPGGPPGMFRP
jgi:tetratricopeptide (TPR) repeat protein